MAPGYSPTTAGSCDDFQSVCLKNRQDKLCTFRRTRDSHELSSLTRPRCAIDHRTPQPPAFLELHRCPKSPFSVPSREDARFFDGELRVFPIKELHAKRAC